MTLRVLLHDGRGGRGRSLLTHIGIRDTMPWLDTAIVPDPTHEYDFSLGLCRLKGEGVGSELVMRYSAPLDDLGPDRTQPPAAFSDWWNEPVLADRLGNTFSRGDFVRYVANQDGGAHIDAKLNRAYDALTRHNSMRIHSATGMLAFRFGGGAAEKLGDVGPPDMSIALVSLRQIAHEVMTTLDRETAVMDDVATVARPICKLPIASGADADRNAPCPCGSGRKYKHCFWRRRPRNVRHTTTGAIAMM